MAELRTGTIVHWHTLSPGLATFQLQPDEGHKFPDYEAGQNIQLRREDCQLTKKIGVDSQGRTIYGPDLDDDGNPKRGAVQHSYSIASAPYETKTKGFLEFYLIRERVVGYPGRLTESLFSSDLRTDNNVLYANEISGDFTLSKRTQGATSVFFVGTGTGLAPFISMIKQLVFYAQNGKSTSIRYTLIHTNRTTEELGYHKQLQEIEAARKFDFMYIPTVSRPTQRDIADKRLGIGRANNLLRVIFGMPLKEEEDLQRNAAKGEDSTEAKAALDVVIPPALPATISIHSVRQRIDAGNTVILACGNTQAMADIKQVAQANQIRFEKEDW